MLLIRILSDNHLIFRGYMLVILIITVSNSRFDWNKE